MKNFFEAKKEQTTISRRLRASCAGMLLVATFGVMAKAGIVSRISATAEETYSLAAGYAQSGQWCADLRTCVVCAEYLFRPESGAGARLDLELDD
jgi:hypothetical protein